MTNDLLPKGKNHSRSDMEFNDEYFCPNCNAILNEQLGFNPDEGSWICKKCGQVLYGDVYEGEKYPGVMWYCNKCHALLNKQPSFSDCHNSWVCTVCGCSNELNEIVMPATRVETFKEKVVSTFEKSKPKIKKSIKWVAIIGGVAATAVGAYLISKNSDTDNSKDTALTGFGTIDGFVGQTCPLCGAPLDGDDEVPDPWGVIRYECTNPDCHGIFYRENGGELESLEDRHRARQSNNQKCSNCGQSLSGGSYTAPWENGNNPDGYVKCPHCGYVNFQWDD